MNVNGDMFLKYQREANMGKSEHVKILDKQALNKFSRYLKKPFLEATKQRLQALKNIGIKLGRPKGSKDKHKRSSAGYIDRWRKQREAQKPSRINRSEIGATPL